MCAIVLYPDKTYQPLNVLTGEDAEEEELQGISYQINLRTFRYCFVSEIK